MLGHAETALFLNSGSGASFMSALSIQLHSLPDGVKLRVARALDPARNPGDPFEGLYFMASSLRPPPAILGPGKPLNQLTLIPCDP